MRRMATIGLLALTSAAAHQHPPLPDARFAAEPPAGAMCLGRPVASPLPGCSLQLAQSCPTPSCPAPKVPCDLQIGPDGCIAWQCCDPQ
jgi:hypothetical protein